MQIEKNIRIMLVDSDANIHDEFRTAVEKDEGFEIVKIANGANEALDYFSKAYPDVIITELNYAQGDGINTLIKIRDIEKELPKKAYIVVTTYVTTPVIMKTLYSKGLADFTFAKSMEDFGAKLILSHLHGVKDCLNEGIIIAPPVSKEKTQTDILTPEERERRVRAYIEKNIINKLCVKGGAKGRKYLIDAILQGSKYKGKGSLMLTSDVYPALEKIHANKMNNIDRCIGHALEYAWLNTEQEVLDEVYPLNITSLRGAPTSKDFIEYHVSKLKEKFG